MKSATLVSFTALLAACSSLVSLVNAAPASAETFELDKRIYQNDSSKATLGEPDLTTALGVSTWKKPSWHFPASGPWSHVSKFGNMLYISGQRGFDQTTGKLVETEIIPSANNTQPGYARILKAYQNMLDIAAAAGATPQDCVRTVVYTPDIYRFRPVANAVTMELWGNSSDSVYPTRTIIEVTRLNDDDIIEVEGTFAVPE